MRPLAVVCLVLALAVVSTVDAREVGKPMWGIKGGIGAANVYGNDSGGMHNRIGGLVGGYVEYPVTPFFSLQAELAYAMKGWKNEDWCSGCSFNQKISYLEIPLLVRVNSPTAGAPGPYLYIGPAVNIKLSDSFEVSRGSLHLDVDAFEVKSFDLGGVMGTGVEFPVGSYTMSLEMRGTVGATPTYKDFDFGAGPREVKVDNVAASFVVGIEF